jgi:hypothetical protein
VSENTLTAKYLISLRSTLREEAVFDPAQARNVDEFNHTLLSDVS